MDSANARGHHARRARHGRGGRLESPGGLSRPACGERPEVPERPEKFETEEAIAEYNAKVEAYNASMERLVTCVREYVTNATADIEQIRRRSREAIDRLNQ